ncbi:MAG: VWA domain-containing protein, partial [Paracoccaceae bacterium]
ADENSLHDEVPEREVLELDARSQWSANEVLRSMDFEQMSATEQADAARMLAMFRLPVAPVRARRLRPFRAGARPDLRAVLRRSLRKGGEIDRIDWRAPTRRPPDLVAICDISGSMSVYSRMMMHFLHALSHARGPGLGRVHAFTFGTQLTNISRNLRLRDADDAMAALGRDAPDWQGGTRIGGALHLFNRDWSRRVLARGAAVLLITDGLERDDLERLANEIERLALSCRRLIWLNPLLRWQEFEPLAGGIRTILPHVDDFRACHSLDSLADLATALGARRES